MKYAGEATGWTDSEKAQGSQSGSWAWTSLGKSSTSPSLILKDFGFSIPPSYYLESITVSINRHTDGGRAVTDNEISLTFDGATPAGNNMSGGDTWQETGSQTDLTVSGTASDWGIDNEPIVNINDTDFGVIFKGRSAGGQGNNVQARVSYVGIEISYALDTTRLQAYRGGVWVNGTLHWWNGSAWIPLEAGEAKIWNGSTWQ